MTNKLSIAFVTLAGICFVSGIVILKNTVISLKNEEKNNERYIK